MKDWLIQALNSCLDFVNFGVALLLTAFILGMIFNILCRTFINF